MRLNNLKPQMNEEENVVVSVGCESTSLTDSTSASNLYWSESGPMLFRLSVLHHYPTSDGYFLFKVKIILEGYSFYKLVPLDRRKTEIRIRPMIFSDQ